MPKSRRQKSVALTKTEKKGYALKSETISKIRDTIDEYDTLYAFSFDNMRSSKFKDCRIEFREDRFFLGKNKVMQVALGKGPEDEYKEELHKVSALLSGSVGLLATSKPREDVLNYFANFSPNDFARAGFTATDDVTIDAGPQPQFQASMVEQLRKLGLDVELKNAVVMLRRDFTICRVGDVLTPEQAKLLTHYDIKLCKFRIKVLCVWKEGEFEQIGAV